MRTELSAGGVARFRGVAGNPSVEGEPRAGLSGGVPQRLNIDGGLSTDILTVKAESGGAGYCVSAKVGSWYSHVVGPGTTPALAETADNCP